jgi:hypothetical protein
LSSLLVGCCHSTCPTCHERHALMPRNYTCFSETCTAAGSIALRCMLHGLGLTLLALCVPMQAAKTSWQHQRTSQSRYALISSLDAQHPQGSNSAPV